MKITTFSIVAGSLACNARCPFCVARMTPQNNIGTKEPEVNWRNFRKACLLAKQAGTTTVLITSKGEPTLFPDQITTFLEKLGEFDFPIIEMQTNGILIADGKIDDETLKRWYDLGLTTVAISIVHYDPKKNHEIYLPYRKPKTAAPAAASVDPTVGTADGTTPAAGQAAAPAAPAVLLPVIGSQPSPGADLTALAAQGPEHGYIDLPALVARLHGHGFSVRLTCIAANGFVDSADEVRKLLAFAKANKVEQVSVTPVSKPFDSRDVEAFQWTEQHHLRDSQKEDIEGFLKREGQRVRTLPHGAIVYDVDGQNLNWSNCLTVDEEPDQLRSLIFFPDGHVRSTWQNEGSILF